MWCRDASTVVHHEKCASDFHALMRAMETGAEVHDRDGSSVPPFQVYARDDDNLMQPSPESFVGALLPDISNGEVGYRMFWPDSQGREPTLEDRLVGTPFRKKLK
jgi:hypothetical protein